MIKFRWWLFVKISKVGWMICPEPHRSTLYRSMMFDPDWNNIKEKCE